MTYGCMYPHRYMFLFCVSHQNRATNKMEKTKQKETFKNELVCYMCDEKVFRSSSASVYADLTVHYKNVHGLDMETVRLLRKSKK